MVLAGVEEAAPVFRFFSFQSSRRLIGLTGLKSLLLEEVASDVFLVIRIFILRAIGERVGTKPLLQACILKQGS